MQEIAALFVMTGGPYFGLAGVDPYDITRDAFTYKGDKPSLLHPVCRRWGRYWTGGPSSRKLLRLGDDGGCFDFALRTLRRTGGVLEHPEGSHAWRVYGLRIPPSGGGWIPLGDGGFTCCVEQGHYGHKARKKTWLLVYGYDGQPPDLIWGKAHDRERADEGFHSAEERAAARAAGKKPIKRLSSTELLATPAPFRDLLISIARNCSAPSPTPSTPPPEEVEVRRSTLEAELLAKREARLKKLRAARRG